MMDTGIKTERHDSQRNAAFHGLGWIIIYMCKIVREKKGIKSFGTLFVCLCVHVCVFECVFMHLSACICVCICQP